jgi:hypothetical protein
MIVYQDLLDCKVPLHVIAKICNVANIYDWQSRGIPYRYQFKLKAIVENAKRAAANKAARLAARAPQVDLFSPEQNVSVKPDYSNKINNLDSDLLDSAPVLVTYANSQSIAPIDVEYIVYAVYCYAATLLICYSYQPPSNLYCDKVDINELNPTLKQQQQRFLWRFDRYAALDTSLLPSISPHYLFLAQLYACSVFARLKAIAEVKDYKHYHLKPYFKLLKPFVPKEVPAKDLPAHLVKYRYALHDTARKVLPNTRLKACHHYAIGHKDDRPTSGEFSKHSSDIGIKYHPTTGTTSFFGLQTCGSVWQCPICANKISHYRGNELAQAMDDHTSDARAFRKLHGKLWCTLDSSLRDYGVTSFVTRTIPHQDHHSLEFILDSFKLADVKLKQHRKYKEVMARYGVIGSVKIYELTVGKNGWHLHVHEVYFHKSEKDCMIAGASSTASVYDDWYTALRNDLYPLWADAADAAGFDAPSYEHGLQVQNGDFAASYVAKWGKEPVEVYWTVDKEMSRSHIKNAKKGLSPFDLLRQYHATGDKMYADLYLDYARVMSGARQMMWSRGLKDHFGVKDKADDVIAAEDQDIEAFEMLTFTRSQWYLVCRHHFKADVLLIALHHGSVAVLDFLKKFV